MTKLHHSLDLSFTSAERAEADAIHENAEEPPAKRTAIPVAEHGCEVCGVRPGLRHRIDCLELWESWLCREHGDEECLCPPDARVMPVEEQDAVLHYGPMADVSRVFKLPRVTHRNMTWNVERELIRLHQQGHPRAAAVLIQANEPLMYKHSKHSFGRGLDNDDIMQIAREGFLKGIAKFNLLKTTRLTTYAMWWVRQEITRALQDIGSTIRVAVHVHDKLQLCRKGFLEESEELRSYARLLMTPSLDIPVGHEEGAATYLDMVPGETPTPEESAGDDQAARRMRALVARALRALPERNRGIIRRRLLSQDEETLKEIGDDLGLSRERIRQIEAKSLRILARELRTITRPDDAVLWGGEVMVEKLRPRKRAAQPELELVPPAEPMAPARRPFAAPKRTRPALRLVVPVQAVRRARSAPVSAGR